MMLLALLGSALTAAETRPLVHAHAHNDYLHARPLLDALEQGFCSIEADIYLVGGELLVAHDLKDATPERTLAALYLDPLQQRVRENRGRVFPGGPPVTLLVDVKSAGAATYQLLHEVLHRYSGILTRFEGSQIHAGAVTVIISGNRVPGIMARQPVRFAAIDGRGGDLDQNPPSALVPLVSENWAVAFDWPWQGVMPDRVRSALQEWVERAHQQGRRVRFWNTPDQREVWATLRAAGVDLIGTDNLEALSVYLRAASPP